MNALMNTLIKNSDFLNFFGLLLTVIFSVYIFYSGSRKTLERERYDNLVFPLFNLLEPYLFQPMDTDIFRQALDIIEKNKSIAGGKFLYILYHSKRELSQAHFRLLCSVVNSEFDRTCRIIGIRRRSFFYRLDRHQYRTKLAVFIYHIGCLILYLSMLFALFIVTAFIYSLLQKL